MCGGSGATTHQCGLACFLEMCKTCTYCFYNTMTVTFLRLGNRVAIQSSVVSGSHWLLKSHLSFKKNIYTYSIYIYTPESDSGGTCHFVYALLGVCRHAHKCCIQSAVRHVWLYTNEGALRHGQMINYVTCADSFF